MDKIDPFTPDLASENFRRLAELFPEAVTETIDASTGQTVRAVDAEALRAAVGAPVLDPSAERYRFTWPDKRKAIDLAFAPTSSVLRPVREKSVGRDGTPGSIDTENLYIEGDNLEALKILRETYLGRVKMIYIDPPYNTGHDFVYEDDFSIEGEEWKGESGNRDDAGRMLADRMVINTESNGRFHTDWLNMIYPRLRLAKDFLSDDGVIFISIDDNEVANLRKVCDEIFGPQNFVAQIVWKRKRGRDNSAKWFSKSHEYILVYAKSLSAFNTHNLELDDETKSAYKNADKDPRGPHRDLACWARGTQGGVKYAFTTKDGIEFSERLWLFSKENLSKMDEENRLIIHGDNIYRKLFLSENPGKIPETLWDDASNAANAADEIKRLFDRILFDTPKPIPFVERMLKIATDPDSIIFDFFSGSATTAHAVMKLNVEDGGKRKFIMVQLPEACAEDSAAAKAGYATICDIGEERIRRAGKKILEKSSAAPDVGFRVYRVDSANMKDVRLAPAETRQGQLELFADNMKEGRTAEDLLAQSMLSLGVPLSKPVAEEDVEGRRVFSVDGDFLVACFERDVPESVVRQIARRRPVYAVLRDASLGSDATMANFDQIFAAESPETVRRVL